MKTAKFEQILKRWGRVYGEDEPPAWDEEGSHGLGALSQRMLEHAELGKGRQEAKERRRKEALTVYVPGTGDRRIIDAAASQRHRCFGTDTRSAAPRKSNHDPLATAIDKLCLMLDEWDHDQAVILRYEYCSRGTQLQDKLPRVQAILCKPSLKLRTYRSQLELARAWMAGGWYSWARKTVT